MGCKRSLSRRLYVVVLGVAVAACAKDKNAVPSKDPASGTGSAPRPGVAAAPGPDDKLEVVWDYTEPLCPRDKGPRKTAARLIGTAIRAIPQEVGFAIQRRKPGNRPDDHLFGVYDDAGKRIEVIPGDKDPGSVISFDSAAWYHAPCAEGTCDARGYGHDLLRVDRVTGKSEKVYGPEHAFVYGQPFGDYFYWASSGANRATGALRRVPRKGKKVETLWEGRGVASVLFVQDVALLADQHSVFAIPLAGGKPKELLKDLKNAQGMATEGTQVYVLDRGDDDSKSGGRVLVVDRATGASSVLATDLPWPTVVAVDGDRLDIMGAGHGNVIAVPRKGGKPTLLIPGPSADWSCHTTDWIRSDGQGLRWVRMNSEDKRGGLFFIPRALLADPIKQWREVMAKQPAAGSAAGSGSGSDEPKGDVDPLPAKP
jgi:hypothetical protein